MKHNPYQPFQSTTSTAAQPKYPRKILVFFFIITIILVPLFFYNKILLFKAQSRSARLQKQTIKNLTIKTNLHKKDTEYIVNFLVSAAREQILPKEITVTLSEKTTDTKGPVYMGTWNKDGRLFSLLYGLTPDGKDPLYLRLWTMPPGDSVDTDAAQTLASEVFAESFRTSVGPLACSPTTDPASGKPITECSRMKTVPSDDLVGITIRAPVSYSPAADAQLPTGFVPPSFIIVSACLVPKDKTPHYAAGSCI